MIFKVSGLLFTAALLDPTLCNQILPDVAPIHTSGTINGNYNTSSSNSDDADLFKLEEDNMIIN